MKVFENAEPGIDVNSASFLQVGETKVRLAGSLLAIGAGTFRGDRLVGFYLDHTVNEWYLSGIATGKPDDDSALVRVRLPVVANGEHRYQIAGGQRLASVVIWQQGLERRHLGIPAVRAPQFLTEVHALVVMEPGSIIDFLDTFESPPRPSLARFVRSREKSLNNKKTTVNRFTYDGDKVTVQKLHYRLLQPCNLRRTG